ncbi:S8 family peptidase [Monashia sp. NPDC004114]
MKESIEGREGSVVGVYPDPEDLSRTEFLYRIGHLLTRDRDAPRVREVLGLPPDPADKRDSSGGPTKPIKGLTLLDIRESRLAPEDPDDPRSQTVRALDLIDRALGAGVASFDRVIHLTADGHSGADSASSCPATEPRIATFPPVPDVTCHRSLGKGVVVAVIDTGIPKTSDGHMISLHRWPWLRKVTGGLEDSHVGDYRGHGLFVAGVLRTMAPKARVHVYPFIYTDGGTFESTLAPQLVAVFRTRPDIISMSAGTRVPGYFAASVDDNSFLAAEQPLLTFEVFREEYLSCSATLLVCAAGNDGTRGPFEPASLCWPVAVGALTAKGKLAKYSNRGHWVDVYSRGSRMVNAFPDGDYTYHVTDGLTGQTVHFDMGMARWSGTSFSTPLVAGLVAARMSWSGENARQAWESLARIAASKARNGRWVLEPGDADPGVQPPCC